MFYLYGLFRPSLLLELGINNLKEKGFIFIYFTRKLRGGEL